MKNQLEYFDGVENIQSISRAHYRKLLKLIPKEGNILEIGCSEGKFLELLKDRGYNVEGIDISPKNIKKLESKGIKGYCIDVDEGIKLNKKYDVIISAEIIEHLIDSIKFLNNSYDLLNEGGIMILTTPNLLSLVNRVKMFFGRDPLFTLEDFHYQVFTPSILINKIKRSKFDKFKISGDYILFSQNRNKPIGKILEDSADRFPLLAARFIVVLRKKKIKSKE